MFHYPIVLSIVISLLKTLTSSNMLISLLALEFLSVGEFFMIVVFSTPESVGINGLVVFLTMLVMEGSLGLTIMVSSTLKVSSLLAETMSSLKF
uniref:NADH dehydrogenase subunit 4L n=1 Tax=Haematopinus asini TaxID=1461129 RepID=A0A059T3Z6_9NEOP|nr:NADH dehydrogenase subunit 4L [Haematopinus asini]